MARRDDLVCSTGLSFRVTPAPVQEIRRVADSSVVYELWRRSMPDADIELPKATLHIGYGPAWRGGQLTEGMSGLAEFANVATRAGSATQPTSSGMTGLVGL